MCSPSAIGRFPLFPTSPCLTVRISLPSQAAAARHCCSRATYCILQYIEYRLGIALDKRIIQYVVQPLRPILDALLRQCLR